MFQGQGIPPTLRPCRLMRAINSKTLLTRLIHRPAIAFLYTSIFHFAVSFATTVAAIK